MVPPPATDSVTARLPSAAREAALLARVWPAWKLIVLVFGTRKRSPGEEDQIVAAGRLCHGDVQRHGARVGRNAAGSRQDHDLGDAGDERRAVLGSPRVEQSAGSKGRREREGTNSAQHSMTASFAPGKSLRS